jgi:Mrp family chromosome partitioning ATPase
MSPPAACCFQAAWCACSTATAIRRTRWRKSSIFVDRPLVHRTDPWRPWIALALAAGLAGFLGWRRKSAVRSERDLTAVLGESLVAARPLAPKQLSQLLLRCWFHRGRTVLPVVSAEGDTGAIALELAKAFAAAGEATLLIDADLRSPSVHQALNVPNRGGLADFLDGRKPRLAHCADNLSVLVAGRSSEDPLELLSRKRLQDLIAVAARRYGVILVATPAAASGPDMQMFAALAGGALVVTHRAAEASALERLRGFLEFAKARVVGTVLAPA